MNKLYITEPHDLNTQLVAEILPDDWKVIEGTPAFDGDNIQDCSALLIRSATIITSSIKESFPHLRHVIRVGVGVDNIDMDFCAKEGIAVYNAPGANADAVSDYVIGMMFVALRKIYLVTKQDVTAWNRFKFTGRSMSGRTIGIIGFGNIGRQIFSKLQGFGCKAFFVHDPFVKKEDMPKGATYAASPEEVLQSSDIITVHVPLTPSTKYLINKNNLAHIADDGILINASRGGIVNEADIATHASDRNLIYIADTVEGEPHVSRELLDTPNVIITPHIAGLTEESDNNMVVVALDNFLNKKAMNG